MSRLDYGERDTLLTILRHHGIDTEGPGAVLAQHLETYAEWIRDIERAKLDRAQHPYVPLVLLSLMGIHGKEAQT